MLPFWLNNGLYIVFSYNLDKSIIVNILIIWLWITHCVTNNPPLFMKQKSNIMPNVKASIFRIFMALIPPLVIKNIIANSTVTKENRANAYGNRKLRKGISQVTNPFKCGAGSLYWSVYENGEIHPCGVCSCPELMMGTIFDFDGTILVDRSAYVSKIKNLPVIKHVNQSNCPFDCE